MQLHKSGWAHSVETWNGEKLVGGLYGIRMGRVLFGESMFSHESNASKYAFIIFVKQLAAEGVALIDCQGIRSPELSPPETALADPLKSRWPGR
jgi:leucyl/phenylalanyl-tRNA--protein transferase